ncbi:MAG: CoA transferase [Actinobacteria bacterium]|nr:CoA transferase [Actinomycetota bacterium]
MLPNVLNLQRNRPEVGDAEVAERSGPGLLDGIRVLDLTIALAGPFTTLSLAMLGAEVVRVESPGGTGDLSRWNPPFVGPGGAHFEAPEPDDISVSMLNRSQGKKSVTLNLKSTVGRQMFLDMARTADVVVENFSAGTADRLGVGYDAVRAVNQGIVYCSISGFGADSPYPDLKAMDIIIQAMSGVMEATGTAGEPPVRVGVPVGDVTGSLYATSAVLAALISRMRTGEGRYIDVSLVDCLAALVSVEHFETFARAGIETRTGNAHARLTPFGVYPAADGYVAIAAHTDRWVAALFGAMGRPELMREERFATRGARVRNASAINALIEGWTRQFARDELVRTLGEEHGVPAAPVRTPDEAMFDRHFAERGSLVPLRHPLYGAGEDTVMGTGMPVRFSGIAAESGRPVPALGEHNASVYAELLGLDADAVEALRRDGVV